MRVDSRATKEWRAGSLGIELVPRKLGNGMSKIHPAQEQRLFASTLTEGFVEQDGSGSGSVERFYAALHGNLDAGVGRMDDVFRQAGALVTNEKGNGLAPIDFPGRSEGWRCVVVRTGGDGGDAVEFELSQENAERCTVDERKM